MKKIDTEKVWAEEKREPGKAEVFFGPKHENEKRGHAVFVSGANGETHVQYIRLAKGIRNSLSGNTLSIVEEQEIYASDSFLYLVHDSMSGTTLIIPVEYFEIRSYTHSLPY